MTIQLDPTKICTLLRTVVGAAVLTGTGAGATTALFAAERALLDELGIEFALYQATGSVPLPLRSCPAPPKRSLVRLTLGAGALLRLDDPMIRDQRALTLLETTQRWMCFSASREALCHLRDAFVQLGVLDQSPREQQITGNAIQALEQVLAKGT